MAKSKNIKEDSYIREFLQLLKGRWYFVAGIIPFILGIIGYYVLASEDPELIQTLEMGDGIRFFIAAAYKSIRFYVLEYDNPEEICNNFLEIARWTAPIVTISGIAAILGNIVKHFKNRFLYGWWSFLNFFKKIFKIGRPFVVIAFYGDDNYESKTLKENLLERDDSIIVKVVEMHNHIPRADLYILFSDDDDNFDFYQKHSKKLEKYCRVNSRKERNRLLSREIVKKDFNWHGLKRKNDINLKDDNKYIIMKTERYSIKDEISDYITLVNMQEIGAFKFWPYRWQGIYFNIDFHRDGICKITRDLIDTLYKNKLICRDVDSSFVKDYVGYLEIGSIYLNYLINIDRDYVNVLCEEIRKNSKKLNKSLRFRNIKKFFHIEDNYVNEFSNRFCNEINNKLEETKCITLDKSKHLQISIIGDNEMAEHLLFTGLQLNIFNKDQKFTYNLFGDWDSYLDKHDNLIDKEYSPNLVSYSSNIVENKNILRESDVIIVCSEDNPKKIVDDLLLITNGIQIDLVSTKQDLFLKYKSNDCVNFYNYVDRISNFEDFVEDNLNIDNALKACKNKYGEEHFKDKLNTFVKEWNDKDSLYRYNYICQEEFFEICDKCSFDKQLRNELNQMRKSRFSDFYEYPESKLD